MEICLFKQIDNEESRKYSVVEKLSDFRYKMKLKFKGEGKRYTEARERNLDIELEWRHNLSFDKPVIADHDRLVTGPGKKPERREKKVSTLD